MTLQPEDFWSFYQWLIRPGAFLESALLQGVVLILLATVLGLIVRVHHFGRPLWTRRRLLCCRTGRSRFHRS